MPNNLHGTALVIGDRGIFIRGKSGSGKTGLALELIARGVACGRYARLVSDDQVFFSTTGGRLIVTSPGTIGGLVEVRGLGPRPIAWQVRSVIDLVVTLVDPAMAQRLPGPGRTTVATVLMPELKLAANSVHAATSAVLAHLGIGLFDTVHMRQNG